MAADLKKTAHRPWPLPDSPWAMAQDWRDLLFAHWPVPVADVQRLVPPELTVEQHGGTAWIGVVPFRMEGVRMRFLPPVPGAGSFPELNVRTYVTHGGRPGVWFFSLDASSALAVETARATLGLPYMRAEMSCHRDGDLVRYSSRRTDERGAAAAFRGTYGPAGDAFLATDGSLDAFLCERYCLFAVSPAGKLLRGDIHHAPWPLRRGEATVEVNTMTEPLGIPLTGAPHLLFSDGVDVALWRPVEC